MSKEAMKLALEALIFNQANWQGKDKAITAIKQALEQEKALQALHDENERLGLYKDAYEHPEPEPVAEVRCDDGGNLTAKFHVRDLPLFAPLYASPPKREWQGLTDEDKQIAFDDTQEGGGFWEFADAIEATLRKKNHG